jgi:hypothetical protein
MGHVERMPHERESHKNLEMEATCLLTKRKTEEQMG